MPKKLKNAKKINFIFCFFKISIKINFLNKNIKYHSNNYLSST